MRVWERQEDLGETPKAYRAFSLYRDLGPDRTLRTVAEAVYGVRWKYGKRTVEGWSSQFDWVERVAVWDAHLEMIRREAVEEHEEGRAREFAERRARLMEKLLENAEKAAEQEAKILEWPLTEQIVERDEDGVPVRYTFIPAGWSKSTARGMHEIAASGVVGAWLTRRVEDEGEDRADFDFSELTIEEMKTYVELTEKLFVRRPSRD